MKKCPFCKADIEDTARFCLYCMKPLNEKEVIPPPQKKKQWWPFVLAAVLLIILLAVILRMPRGKGHLPGESTVSSSTEQTTELKAEEPTNESTQSEETTAETTLPEETTLPTITPTTPEETTPEETVPKETIPEETVPEETVPEETIPEETVPEETVPEETQPQVSTEPEDPKTDVVYAYRDARAGDDFNAQYQNTGSDIVITGIVQPSDDGVYDIPSYIDGKKVIAIVANAFDRSNAKVVYIPATVKTIWNHAFAGCGLTDIFFRGNAIYTESNAFPDGITIHCSASCSDRNFRYYKDCAANYGATWAEWNG